MAPRPNVPVLPHISKQPFGKVGGTEVELYTLTNAHGLTAKVMTYGATLQSLRIPDRAGKLGDVVLGFDSVDAYVAGSPYFGATVGRVGNRIRDAKFELAGKKYTLAVNDKPHHLHGGVKGWDKVVWAAEPVASPDGPTLELTTVSIDGDEGYPGTVTATCSYTLTPRDELRIEMRATTRKTTIVNMVHHTYWNLAGEGSGHLIKDHVLTLHADRYTPGDPLVPTGEVRPVKGSPYDFTAGKAIGKDLEAAGGTPIGFDNNFVVDGPVDKMRPVAVLRDPASGRVMTLAADQPGVQFYSGNFLDGKLIGKSGRPYPQYAGLCLETQKFPDAINVKAWRHQVILKPGQPYHHTMLHRFSIE